MNVTKTVANMPCVANVFVGVIFHVFHPGNVIVQTWLRWSKCHGSTLVSMSPFACGPNVIALQRLQGILCDNPTLFPGPHFCNLMVII